MTDGNTERLIEQNNQLREQLTKENETYYSDLLVYTRIRGFFLDEKKLEEQLLEILQDILDAQKEGLTAADYYGHQPQILAEQLLDTLPKSSKRNLMKWAGYIFGLSSFYTLISQFSDTSNQLRLGNFLINGVLTIVFIACLFLIIQKSIYTQLIKNKILLYIVLFVVAGTLFFGVIGAQLFLPNFFAISVSNSFMIGFILLFLVVITGYFFMNRQKQAELLIAILPFVYFSAISGLLLRIPALHSFFTQLAGKMTLVAGSIACLVWFYIRLFAFTKKKTTS